MPEGPRQAASSWPGSPHFSTTHWSVVLEAGATQDARADAALEELCRTYWHPIYCFARRRGQGPEDAQDLTQEFFKRLIDRRDFSHVERDKGRFRSFLLACLNNLLAKEWRDRNALKRGGGQIFVPIDLAIAEAAYAADNPQNQTPEQLYDQRWALGVMERAMKRLRREFAESGKEGLFDELRGFLSAATEDGAYDLAADRLNMTRIAVATAVHRLRRSYRERVREEVAQTVTTPLELEEEMRYLLEVLRR